MFEEINENISRLVDGDLGHDETLDLLKKMQSDDILKCKMSRYQAISHALKTDQFHQVSPDFSRKVFQEIQQEPSYFLPQLKPKTPAQSQAQVQNRFPKRKLFAVAASALAAAVLVGQGIRNDQSGNQYPTLSASTIPQQSFPTALTQAEQSKQRTRHPLNAQFNDYLQAHNSSVYTNGEANFQSYAKVAAYGRE
jgi:sigma-E factor negative regulatory protein RseA